MTVTTNSAPHKHNLWAWVPVALLSSLLGGLAVMTTLAVQDPHFATEANYYAKAVRWDETQAQASANERLGYQVQLSATFTPEASSEAELRLLLRDEHGRALSRAQVRAEAFPNAYLLESTRLSFAEVEPGVYTARVKPRHTGLWEFRLSASVAGQHFTNIQRIDVLPAAHGAAQHGAKP